MANLTEEKENMALMNLCNLDQASETRFALIIITENREPKTENLGPEAL